MRQGGIPAPLLRRYDVGGVNGRRRNGAEPGMAILTGNNIHVYTAAKLSFEKDEGGCAEDCLAINPSVLDRPGSGSSLSCQSPNSKDSLESLQGLSIIQVRGWSLLG